MKYHDLVKLTAEVENNIKDLHKYVAKFTRKVNAEMDELSQTVHDATKRITDNVNHARRLQHTILTPMEEVKKDLPDSFIINMPQNGIVGGDFYYVKKVDHLVYFAAVDCTGHGIASSLITVIGHNFINDAVIREQLKTADGVLEYLDVEIDKFLRHGEHNEVKDAMDVALCILNLDTLELQFSGSKRPLYLFSDGVLEDIKGDRFDIGLNEDSEPDPFINHTRQLKKGDTVYAFTDGYADQFDKTDKERLKIRAFREKLIEILPLSMDNQKAVLEQFILDWMGETEQTDDILVIGVRI